MNQDKIVLHNQGRQGDVLITRVSDNVVKGNPVKPTPRGYVLAEGEATGHAHCITETEFTKMFQDGDQLYLTVESPTEVSHEEHGTIPLEFGSYRVTRQREYTPERNRYVAD